MIMISENTPWSLAPLDGKYYGTVILDKRGRQLFCIWGTYERGDEELSRPSEREIERFGDDFSEQAWREYCYDSHYEAVGDHNLAMQIVEAANDDALREHDVTPSQDDEEILLEIADRISLNIGNYIAAGAFSHDRAKLEALQSKLDRFNAIRHFIRNL